MIWFKYFDYEQPNVKHFYHIIQVNLRHIYFCFEVRALFMFNLKHQVITLISLLFYKVNYFDNSLTFYSVIGQSNHCNPFQIFYFKSLFSDLMNQLNVKLLILILKNLIHFIIFFTMMKLRWVKATFYEIINFIAKLSMNHFLCYIYLRASFIRYVDLWFNFLDEIWMHFYWFVEILIFV
jgi:hypothetical protein